MPELPEVETVRRGLEKILSENPVVENVVLRRPDLREPIPESLPQVLRNQEIVSIRRRAKYLLFETPDHTIINHLGMTGTWRIAPPGSEATHDHVYFNLRGGVRLAFNDPRRFGILDLATREKVTENKWLKHLGVEPLDAEFTAESMLAKAKGRSVPVKNFIMDQKVVVGVGNIYSSEALYLAGVKPQRQACRIQLSEWKSIVKNVQKVLSRSIERGGTTLNDYRQVEGHAGNFQNHLKVYGRTGEPCRKCREPVKMKVLGGRSTYWCSKCQK